MHEMTDKELIQALRYCADGDCFDCRLWDSVECHREVTYRNSADRLEALLAENERLSEELRATERTAELLNHANAILKEQNEHLREVTKMVGKDTNVPTKWGV